MYSCINDVSTQSWYIRGRSMDSRARVDHFRNPLETAKHHLISCRKWRKVIRNNKLPGGRNVPSEILLKSPFDFCCSAMLLLLVAASQFDFCGFAMLLLVAAGPAVPAAVLQLLLLLVVVPI